MSQLDIKTYGASVLREKAKPVEEITQQIKALADEMLITMRRAPGIGLAAPQVGHSIRMMIVTYGLEEERPEPKVLINPEILEHNDEIEKCEEGCLSVPEITGVVPRWTWIRIRALNLDGEIFEEELEGWTARIFQHEYDHLEGVLFVDRLSRLKKDLVKRRLKKRLKEEAENK